MALCHIGMNLLEEIIAEQKIVPTNYDKLKLLWKKFYLFEAAHKKELIHELWGIDAINFFMAMNEALGAPIYMDEKPHTFQIVPEEIPFSKDTPLSHEQMVFLIRQAMANAADALEKKYRICETNSSLYSCCTFTSEKIASFLNDYLCTAKVITTKQAFSAPNVPHVFCYAKFYNRDLHNPHVLIDMTYRQFFTIAATVPEARHKISERIIGVLPLMRKTTPAYFIGPGYYMHTRYPEQTAALLENGFIEGDEAISAYANSFYAAELSIRDENVPDTEGEFSLKKFLP